MTQIIDKDEIIVPDQVVELKNAPSIEIEIKMGVDSMIEATFEETSSVNTTIENPVFINNPNKYSILTDKPQINDVTLEGNKSFEDLGEYNLSNFEIENILQRAFSN